VTSLVFNGVWFDQVWDAQHTYVGLIDEVAIYPTVLTPTQITTHYALASQKQVPLTLQPAAALNTPLRLDANGSLITTPATYAAPTGPRQPLIATPLARDTNGALFTATATYTAPTGPARATTVSLRRDANGSVVTSSVAYASPSGPLTNLLQLPLRYDANGSLVTATVAYAGPDGTARALGNQRGRLDANGSLIVSVHP
jgi:hypothetical protein